MATWIANHSGGRRGNSSGSNPAPRTARGQEISSEPLAGEGIFKLMRARAAKTGLAAQFTPHSLRAGFMTETGLRKIHIADTMAMSDHRDLRTAMGYLREGEAWDSEAARLTTVSKEVKD